MANEFNDVFLKKNNLPEVKFDDVNTNDFITEMTPYYMKGLLYVRNTIEKYHNENKRCFVVVHIFTTKIKSKVHTRDELATMDIKIKDDAFAKYVDTYDPRFMIPICVKHKIGCYRALVSLPWVSPDEIQNYKKEIILQQSIENSN